VLIRNQRFGMRMDFLRTTAIIPLPDHLAKDELKALLRKMAVVREDLDDIVLSHGVHGNTVSEAVLLIGALFVECDAIKEGFMGLGLHGDTWVSEDASHKGDSSLPQAWPSRTTNGEKFGEDFIRGPEMVFSEGAADVERLLVPAISWTEEGYPVKGIGKEMPHADFLGVP
jgi:hypothetical protein